MFERAKEIVSRFLGTDRRRRQAHELYVAVAEAARRPAFYRDMGVSDDVEGRYDMLSLHMILVLRRLKQEKARTATFAQLLFDIMFRDVDDNLREMGVGDLKVGKKVRGYAEAFFGRALAYEKALDGEEPLERALARNVYGSEEPQVAEALAAYARSADEKLSRQTIEDITAGSVAFPDPEEAAAPKTREAMP